MRSDLKTPKNRIRLMAIVVVMGLVLSMYLSLSPRTYISDEPGRVLVVRDTQSRGAPVKRRANVELASGDVVVVRIPRGTPLRRDDVVQLSVYKRQWPPRTRTYRLAIVIE